MKISDKDASSLDNLLKKYGQDGIETFIKSVNPAVQDDLTIVANGGLHTIPSDFIFGDLYIASEGNLDFSDAESVSQEIDKILLRLKAKLKSRRWRKVYLIPFGHAVISMSIKMAVYRTLRIETSDIFYLGNGKYGVVEKDTRRIMLG